MFKKASYYLQLVYCGMINFHTSVTSVYIYIDFEDNKNYHPLLILLIERKVIINKITR